MKTYSRVSYAVRCQISALLQAKKSIPEIATLLGFHKTTIYRELKRNGKGEAYQSESAHLSAMKRYAMARRPYKLNDDILAKIEAKIDLGWSPEQITQRFRLERQPMVSHQTIYNYFNLYPWFKFYRRRPTKRGAGRLAQRNSYFKGHRKRIWQRPEVANKRLRIGDWERDTIHTKDAVQILIMNDRKSRLTKIRRLDDRTTVEVNRLTLQLAKETGKKILTLTNDNGPDFKGKDELEIPTYFCDPLKPHQRGTVENTAGLLRQYIKRDTDTTEWPTKEFKKLENLLNFRPRKVLGYRTPFEVYYSKKVALVI